MTIENKYEIHPRIKNSIEGWKEIYSISWWELVVACGGIENSRLLLWSRDNNKQLFRDLPIGINWMEHPYYATGKVIAYNSKIFSFFKPFPNKTLGSESEYVGGEVFLQPTDSLMKKANFVNARLTLTLS